MIIENLPAPFDRRAWQEATTLRAAGYHVSIVCPKGRGHSAGFETIDGIDVYRHSMPFEAAGALGYLLEYGWAMVCELALALRVFVMRGFDVIHACNPPDTIFILGRLFRPLGVVFVFDHHDINPELFEAKFGHRGLLYRVVRWLEKASFRTADVSIATNESYRRIAIERGGVSPERVFVVRSGPSFERMKILPATPELRCGKRFLVGYVGVMAKQDGLHHLLAAARHIVQTRARRDVHFGLVGDGPELDRLRALSREYGLEDFVTFTGRVPDRELLAMLNTADVCVNPDVWSEMNDKSTMNKVMEYMALAKPVVQFDLTEGRHSAGESSLYAKPDDAIDLAEKIIELLDDPARREAMGRAGRRRVETVLEWRHEAPKLLAAYAELFPEMSVAQRKGGEARSDASALRHAV